MGGSGWNITSKAYNHYGPWVLGPDEPLKHLFTTSGDLKWAQNGLKLMVLSPLHLLGCYFGWLWVTLASKAYIHNGPWVLGPDLPLKHLFTTSGSLKKVLNHPQITLKLIFKPTRMHFWVALGDSWPPKPISMMDHGFWVQIYP